MAVFNWPQQQVTIPGAATEATQLLILAEVEDINTNTADVATEAKQDTQITAANSTNTKLDTLNAKDFATQTTLAALNTKVTTVNTGAVTISTALPAGNNNIGDVDVASLPSLPAGSNNIGDVDVVSSALPTGAATEATLNSIYVDIDNALFSGTQGDQNAVYVNYSSTNLPGNASLPLELISALSLTAYYVHPFDTGGAPCELMVGGSGSETRVLVMGPGVDCSIKVNIGAGERISIRRLDSASALAVGDLSINFIGI